MAKIAKVEAGTAVVPLDVPQAFARRGVSERHYCLVRVTGDDGVTGIGFCYAGHAGGRIATLAVRDLLGPLLIGEDPFLVEGLWERMYFDSQLHGRAGSVMRAISALDIALWDRNARALGLPLASLLGAHKAETVPAYASGGYYSEGKSAKDLGGEMRRYVDAGFKAVKMKTGRLDPRGEEARVEAAREAIGPDILLMLDANNAWQDVPAAMEYCRRFEPYDPFWIEEPFGPDDIENHARLAAEQSITVATGEILAGRWMHKELLDAEGALILQTDAAVCGGITEFRRIAAMAHGYGVTLYPHWFHDLHVHLVAATPNARMVEYFPDDHTFNFRRLVGTQLEVRDGALVLPKGPGLGFDLDDAALERYLVDGWS